MKGLTQRQAGRREKFRGERGLTLVESLVAITVVVVVVAAFSVALSTGALGVRENDREAAAQNLAQAQLEYTKGYPYSPGASTYPTVNATDGYSITVSVGPVATPGDINIQKVTANISRDGQVLLSVADYKVKR